MNGVTVATGSSRSIRSTGSSNSSNIINHNHSNNNHHNVNLRSVAQEVVSWYVDRRHPYQTHSSNVKEHLRGPIIALTARIIWHETTTCTTTIDNTSSSLSKQDDDDENASNTTTVVVATGITSTPTTASSTNTTDHTNNIDTVPRTSTTNEVEIDEKRNRWRQSLQHFGDASFSFHDLFSTEDTESIYDRMTIRSKARIDAFIDSVTLAVVSNEETQSLLPNQIKRDPPQRQGSVDSTDLSLIDGLVGFRSLGIRNHSTTMNIVSSLQRVTRSSSLLTKHNNNDTNNYHAATKSGPLPPKPHPQLDESELVTRIELYLRALSRVVTYTNDCVVEYEPNKALKVRTRFVVSAFVNTVGTVRHVNPVLTRLLIALTKELLSVPTLSEDLIRIIRNIVCNYVHATSFASLAFLSSPESSADQRLTPAILKYLLYLQKNWQSCERDCDIELMLSTVIDPQLRHMYKTAEFQSIGHLLEVYQSHRHMLQNIAIPPRLERQSEEERIRQAMKDISREIIAVNGSVLPRVTNRFDLIQVLTSALNMRPLYSEVNHGRRSRRGYKKKKGLVGKKSSFEGTDLPSGLSGNEADTDSNYVLSESSMDDTDGGQTDDTTTTTGSRTTTSPPSIARRKFPTTAIVDLLTKRLLLAVSRTGTMGDAYYVVRDLFGGEDVEVVSSSQHYLAGGANSVNALMHYHHPTTIDLFVRLSSVTIKSHASFDVYPKSMVGDCEPLIQIHATTTETIALQEIRSTDEVTMTGGPNETVASSISKSDTNVTSSSGATENINKSDRIILERTTETTGYRYLSIRPALYEKVSVWPNTPS